VKYRTDLVGSNPSSTVHCSDIYGRNSHFDTCCVKQSFLCRWVDIEDSDLSALARTQWTLISKGTLITTRETYNRLPLIRSQRYQGNMTMFVENQNCINCPTCNCITSMMGLNLLTASSHLSNE